MYIYFYIDLNVGWCAVLRCLQSTFVGPEKNAGEVGYIQAQRLLMSTDFGPMKKPCVFFCSSVLGGRFSREKRYIKSHTFGRWCCFKISLDETGICKGGSKKSQLCQSQHDGTFLGEFIAFRFSVHLEPFEQYFLVAFALPLLPSERGQATEGRMKWVDCDNLKNPTSYASEGQFFSWTWMNKN